MATRLVTENEFLSAAVDDEDGHLKFTRDSGETVDAGKVRVDVTPEVAEARDEAVAARDAAVAARDAAEAVPTTNDTVMAAVAADDSSAFSTQLSATIVSTPTYLETPPAYAGSRPHSYDRALSLYNGEAPSLVIGRSRMARALRGESTCRFLCAGDSRTRGEGVAPGTGGQREWGTFSLPAQLRDMLGAREGEIYFDSGDDRFTAIAGLANYPNPYGNYMQTTTNVASSITVALPESTGFDLWMFRTGTTEVASISVDGGAAETFTPGSGASWKRFEKRGLANTPHTVTITIPALSTGSFSLSRIAPYYGATGLTVTNAGRSSSDASHWDATSWNYLLPTITGANAHVPDVVLLSIGTNWGSSTYANLQSIVTKLQTAGAVVLLGGFGPRQEDTTDPVFNTRRGLMYNLADEFNLPLFDHLQAIGSWAVANGRGLFADTVHETTSGLALEAAGTVRMLAL